MTELFDHDQPQPEAPRTDAGRLAPSAEPTACACSRDVLARALDAVLDLEAAELEAVLQLAEAGRPGVLGALRAAFEAEAAHLAALAQRARTAAGRLAAHPATPG